MSFTIPDAGEATATVQELLFQEQLDILVAGIAGSECVLSGCAVTAQGSPDMTCAVAKGSVLSQGVLFPVTAGNVTITTASGANPRLDLVVVTSAGAKAVRAGTAAASPKPPARSVGDVVLAIVYVPTSDTTISSDQITDQRVFRTQGPLTIQKDTTAVTTNTTAAAVTVLSCVLPNGFFLAGKKIRGVINGNILLNSGTPTVTVTISYGGTTMYAFTSAAATASATRRGLRILFELVAQGNADQTVGGSVQITSVTSTLPTTGIGGLGAGLWANPAISGASAVDSDTADRTLLVTVTMSVSNVANEIVKEYAAVELV